MTTRETIELAVAIALIVGAIFLYRKRGKQDPRHGSQTAVLLFVNALLLAIHGLGLMNYHPSPAEIEASRR